MLFKNEPSGPLNRMPMAVEKINPISFIDGWKKVVIAFTAPGLGRLLDGDSNGCSVNDTSSRIAVTVCDKLLPEGKRMDLTPSTICFSIAANFRPSPPSAVVPSSLWAFMRAQMLRPGTVALREKNSSRQRRFQFLTQPLPHFGDGGLGFLIFGQEFGGVAMGVVHSVRVL